MSGRIMALARLLRERKISCRELIDRYICRIERLNPLLNAYVFTAAKQGYKQAERAQKMIDGGFGDILCGIPVAVKDNICTEGVPTTCCSKILQGHVPLYSAYAVHRLEERGAILLGKTNMDEFAMGSSSETSCYGAPSNPVNLSKSAGGSSGGSAAAVAADIAAFALGSDTGGSVRQPASFCGVTGFRPTYGTVSRSGLIAYASSLDQIGPIAASAEDAAIIYDAIRGRDCLDMTSVESPSAPSLVETDIKKLTVGVPREFFSDMVSDEVKSAIGAAICLIERAGARIKEVSFPHLSAALSAYYVISCAEASSNLGRYDGVRYGRRIEGADVEEMMVKTRSAYFGREVKRRIMLGTFVLSGGYKSRYYARACAVRESICSAFEQIFGECDAIITPTAPTAAFDKGGNPSSAEAYSADICTVPASLAGLPAVSVPCGLTEGGLPIGMQIICGRMKDSLALSLAHFYERAADVRVKLCGEVLSEL